MLPEKGRLLEPKSASGQNARLRAGIEKETEGVTLVSTRHTSRQFPLHPYRGALLVSQGGRKLLSLDTYSRSAVGGWSPRLQCPFVLASPDMRLILTLGGSRNPLRLSE
jgi:hypothetical protein